MAAGQGDEESRSATWGSRPCVKPWGPTGRCLRSAPLHSKPDVQKSVFAVFSTDVGLAVLSVVTLTAMVDSSGRMHSRLGKGRRHMG